MFKAIVAIVLLVVIGVVIADPGYAPVVARAYASPLGYTGLGYSSPLIAKSYAAPLAYSSPYYGKAFAAPFAAGYAGFF